MKADDIIKIATDNGYIASGWGYVRKSENITHWLSIYDGDMVQLYGVKHERDWDECYDTGMIKPLKLELEILIKIFKRNHV